MQSVKTIANAIIFATVGKLPSLRGCQTPGWRTSSRLRSNGQRSQRPGAAMKKRILIALAMLFVGAAPAALVAKELPLSSVAAIREKFPQLADLSDSDAVDAVWRAYYRDLPKAQFRASFGLQPGRPIENAQSAASAAGQGDGLFRCPGPPVLYTDAITAEKAAALGCRAIAGGGLAVHLQVSLSLNEVRLVVPAFHVSCP